MHRAAGGIWSAARHWSCGLSHPSWWIQTRRRMAPAGISRRPGGASGGSPAARHLGPWCPLVRLRAARAVGVVGSRSSSARRVSRSLHAGGLTARPHSGATTASVCRAWRHVSPTTSRRFRARTAARSAGTPLLRPSSGGDMPCGPRHHTLARPAPSAGRRASRCGCALRPRPGGPISRRHIGGSSPAPGAREQEPVARRRASGWCSVHPSRACPARRQGIGRDAPGEMRRGRHGPFPVGLVQWASGEAWCTSAGLSATHTMPMQRTRGCRTSPAVSKVRRSPFFSNCGDAHAGHASLATIAFCWPPWYQLAVLPRHTMGLSAEHYLYNTTRAAG
jgi:hypothetical protein